MEVHENSTGSTRATRRPLCVWPSRIGHVWAFLAMTQRALCGCARLADHMAQAGDVAEACSAWQSGRDGGSTPIRAAARRLTHVPHYFRADWLQDIEERAAADDRTMRRAR